MRAVSFLVFLVLASPALAHYHLLLPDNWSVKKDEATTLRLTFGHPFEHQIFDCAGAKQVQVRAPDGKVTDLTGKLEKVTLPGFEDRKVTAWRLPFTPTQRGDYIVQAKMKAVWMEEEGEFWEDTVRVILHVQAQKGWGEAVGDGDLEWLPLTRPYGLLPGVVFQAGIRDGKGRGLKPLVGLVEVERYNLTTPKNLPPDEFITRTVKTDPNGVVTTTLHEPGWWCMTTSRLAGGMVERDGKKGPLRERSTLWVYVSEAPSK
jgi:cobalt/nickel transport protein